MAVNEAGITLVNLGKPQMMTMVRATKPNKIYKEVPVSHAPETSLNCSSWDMKIMMARPLTNPKITGCGTKRINLPSLKNPAKA